MDPQHVGIAVAILANVLNGVSFVPQKLAHNRAQRTGTHYLRQPAWWLGTVLNVLGELGNFLSYSLAPASVVAPLGAVGVMSNAVASRLQLKERMTLRASLGTLLCAGGAAAIVFSVPPSSSESSGGMDSAAVWHNMRSLPFVFLLMFQLSALGVLLPVKEPKAREHVLYYVLLCSVMASMLIVATKGVATYGMTALRGEPRRVFTDPVFYGILVWFVLCLVVQGNFWNQALATYDASKLVPVYFVLYVMTAMLGAAVLYGELLNVPWLWLGVFAAGCTITFAGVFLVSGKPDTQPQTAEALEQEFQML